MTRYRVAVTETYADGATDQPWSVTRRVLTAEGTACERPVEVKANGRRRLIPCGQRLPADRQCAACRTEIDIVNVRKGRSCT
ncbi:hypothetical protein GBF35_50475 [Nonomuraea phyllanthi]|uniref:hypothetical protein n=1 Tax=Nonomuraea phyllanthi TaxID=2219224 RepID=UPI001293E519|nr:hypothetical protein [Nonomuraea phyllanthi]QFY13708.1 hypothetical protein GBF35_50475 [Nonomuraea phyllanthi]